MATSQRFSLTFTIPTMLGLRLGCERFWTDTVLSNSDLGFCCCAVFTVWPKLPFKLARLALYSIPKTLLWTIPKTLVWSIPKAIILGILGFGSRGPERDSWASNYQRTRYGGYIPARSGFSRAQRYGATSCWYHDFECDCDLGESEESKHSGFWMLMRIAWGCGCIFFLNQGAQQLEQLAGSGIRENPFC
ncbi:hypothetical protein FA13DRAFT_1731022 [Coprinellus micaceus]|uniref:Uncharacterized protein n=1 Tax=Coprinellus micaceus TaxID=71717 RepID=A0A4Y7TH12_COPMI|nr:hypothetical protein FA13DRAFT_1731022 [Coprinellus micaceus]